MSKKYFIPQVDILAVETSPMMSPSSPPSEPHTAPKRNFVPGPGASYCPPAKIV